MRSGRRLAIDVGSVRIGLAQCDSDCILSSPLAAITRSQDEQSLQEIVSIIEEIQPIEVYVGDPVSLSGNETESTVDARTFAKDLANLISAPLLLVDERLTTVSAAAKLRGSGQTSREMRSKIDSASAVEILEFALATERSTGNAPGRLVGSENG